MSGKGADSPLVVGVAWYREVDWPRAKASFPDADDLHDTYDEWLESAQQALEQIRQGGIIVVPVFLDIDHFTGWCLARGRTRDASARSEYVVEMMRPSRQGDKFP